MKIRIKWFITFLALVILYVGIIIFGNIVSNKANLLKKENINTGNQNFSLAYDNVKKILLVGTYQNKLLAFDAKGNKIWEFAAKGPVREIKLDENSRKAYVGCEDTNVYILDLDKGQKLNTISVERRIYSIDVNKDGSLIAVSAGVSTNKHKLLVYDASGKEAWSKDIGITSKKVAFSSDYSKLFLGTERAEILVFDINGKQLDSIKLDTQVADLMVVKDSSRLAVLTEKCTYYLFDENLKQISSVTLSGTGYCIGVSKDLKWAGIGTEEGNFYITDITGKLLYSGNASAKVTQVLTENNKTYVTGLGNFVYGVNNSKLGSIKSVTLLNNIIRVLIYIVPVLLFILLILSFEKLSDMVIKIAKTIHKHRTAYILLIPTFALLAVFNYYPIFTAFTRAFTDWNMTSDTIKFNGFANFRMMLQEGYFFIGLKNLLILMVTSILKTLTIPLLIGELVFLMRSDSKKYWFRFLFVLPMVVPGIVSTLMWQNMYDPTIGLFNQILKIIGHPEWQRVWLGDPNTAIWAIVYMGFPFVDAFAFLVYYGGLINIPGELFEAAKVDGSNGWINFIHIQLPLITPQIKMLIILSFIGTIQNFMPILILTGGGPGTSTYVPGLELYYNATKFGRYGYACALGVVMFIAIFIGTLFNMKIKTTSENGE